MVELFEEIVGLGKAGEAIKIIDAANAGEKWRPLKEALAAIDGKSIDYLNGVAPEVREPALEILKTLQPSMLDQPKARGRR